MKIPILLSMFTLTSFAGINVIETATSTSLEYNGKSLWTYNHNPADAKPHFHPVSATDETMFTDYLNQDHPWHRGVWFSWKLIDGVNYWEEDRATRQSVGKTKLLCTERTIDEDKTIHFDMDLAYAPSDDAKAVMREKRIITVSAPDQDGTYTIDWSLTFHALEKDVVLDRKGGYAGLSVRMNKKQRIGASYLSNTGLTGEAIHRQTASWFLYNAQNAGSLLLMEHPNNLTFPAKWFMKPEMPYFSPAVICDAKHIIKAGEMLKLRYRLLINPKNMTEGSCEKAWKSWSSSKVVIFSGANNNH